MANQEHIDILKQGVDAWNQWRQEHPNIRPDLTRANPGDAFLNRGDFIGTDLFGASLIWAKLDGSNFSKSTLSHADLSKANLNKARFVGADLIKTKLTGANLSDADFSNADLREADLNRANLCGANFSRAHLGGTSFGNVDLQLVKGLELVYHEGPSTVGIDTIYRSGGNIPEAFLKGAGIDDTFITYIRSLVGKPIDFYSCFISYSSKDEAFAKRLYADLQSSNVRCWFAPEDMRIGDKIRSRIDEAIRQHDKLLLVLSEYSVESTWVEKEVETAFEKERQRSRLVLFPIRLDENVMVTTQAWAADIRRTRHIGDFRFWKDHDQYQKAFSRLLHDLKSEVPKAEI